MLLTDTEKEINAILRAEGLTQSDVARMRGIARQSVHDAIKRPAVLKSFVEMMEAIGYDIEIEFVRKK